jgi:hypothetical protein
MRKRTHQTDGAACFALWKNKGKVERRRASRRPEPRVALSPVCETMGGIARLSHHADEQQIFDETGLEAGSNY